MVFPPPETIIELYLVLVSPRHIAIHRIDMLQTFYQIVPNEDHFPVVFIIRKHVAEFCD